MLNRRPAGDPTRIKDDRLARQKEKRKMKRLRIGVYIGKDTDQAMKVGRADFVGLLALGVDDLRLGIKRCLVAKVAIGQPSISASIWPAALLSPSTVCLPSSTMSGCSSSTMALSL